jgi:hypothetical protein
VQRQRRRNSCIRHWPGSNPGSDRSSRSNSSRTSSSRHSSSSVRGTTLTAQGAVLQHADGTRCVCNALCCEAVTA